MVHKMKDLFIRAHKEVSDRRTAVLILSLGLAITLIYMAPIQISQAIEATIEEIPTIAIQSLPEPEVIQYDPPKDPSLLYYHKLDQKSFQLLARQIAIETEGCSEKAKRLVAQCILDRTETKTHSNGTVYSTLTWSGQFDYRGNYKIYPEDYEAIDWVFYQGNRVTEERIIYFCSPAYLRSSVRNWFYSFNKVAESEGLVFFSNIKRGS